MLYECCYAAIQLLILLPDVTYENNGVTNNSNTNGTTTGTDGIGNSNINSELNVIPVVYHGNKISSTETLRRNTLIKKLFDRMEKLHGLIYVYQTNVRIEMKTMNTKNNHKDRTGNGNGKTSKKIKRE